MSETPKTGFVVMRPIYRSKVISRIRGLKKCTGIENVLSSKKCILLLNQREICVGSHNAHQKLHPKTKHVYSLGPYGYP